MAGRGKRTGRQERSERKVTVLECVVVVVVFAENHQESGSGIVSDGSVVPIRTDHRDFDPPGPRAQNASRHTISCLSRHIVVPPADSPSHNRLLTPLARIYPPHPDPRMTRRGLVVALAVEAEEDDDEAKRDGVSGR
jgi:hypothetical protein